VRLKRARLAAVAVLVLAALVLAGGAFWGYTRLQASLPVLDGSVSLPGLASPVSVTRDALGIPTVSAGSREDVARAMGFLHAQERFFQMDLSRRRAAGELAELVGVRALEADREIRIHRFRSIARQAVAMLSATDARVLDAYTAGVNAGLRALAAVPFEYLLLRESPRPWQKEDSFLVVLSMFVTLQDADGTYESTLATMRDVLPKEMFELLAPRGTEWDAPITGPAFPTPPVPNAETYDLRSRRKNERPANFPLRPRDAASVARPGTPANPWLTARSAGGNESAIGSNSMVVSGAHTDDRRPLVANDMHLPVRVPNTWYRAVMTWRDASDESGSRTLVGVTLPGVPALVVGSNTHVAWGFTNTYADWGDIVLLEVDERRPGEYRTPEGWRAFDTHEEIIRVAGQPDVREMVQWTIWGPVMKPDYAGRPRVYRWVAHDADRLATALTPLEHARTVEEAFDAANGIGTPGQNFVVADRSGTIGWSIYGAIPWRLGLDGRLPVSWADGLRGWNEYLMKADYPRVINPPSGRIWTANARMVDGPMLEKLGDGSYEVGSRATIIRNRLMAKERFSKTDLLDIQLDTSASFLGRWRELALRTLDPQALAKHPDRGIFRDILLNDWSDRADADSVSYRLTRTFREAVTERVIRFLLVECYEKDPEFDYTTVRRREGPIWKVVTEQPMHLLDPRYATWSELLLDALDAVIGEAPNTGSTNLRERVWSDYNVAAFRHPLSASVPFAGRWLDMPARALPGDLFTPRMQWGANAASERMIVSPGRESEGIMHMPGGQSGHPLSPFYRNSHDAWAFGEPTPLMPGAAIHTLMLEPSK
jgi:penicillin amidase